jgi:UPF0755 protein
LAGILFMLLVILIIGFGLFFIRPAESEGEYRIITVKEGMSLSETAERLEQSKIITNRTLFLLWARLMGYSRKIKAGEYRLSSSMAPIRIMEVLTRGIIITHPVTIPEGFSINQIGELLAEKKLVNLQDFMSIVQDPETLKKYGIPGPNLEGYLYPDTYQFGKGLSASSIVDVMITRFKEVVEPLRANIDESGMSLEQVLTLASIVEKETGSADERPLIASVFLNRLKKGMRLESDPTVIYGIKDFSGNIKREHLSQHTPYNTYTIKGLPPGPIANPGLESLKAVVFPAETDFLYFVSKNDGTHHFSKTLKEHNNAVYIYQKKRRSKDKRN